MQQNKIKIKLSGVTETLLIPLWGRVKFSGDHSPLLNDTKAIEIVKKIDYDFSTFDKALHFDILRFNNLINAVRAKQFDDKIKEYITKHPYASVINIGAGLDTAFYRVDNGLIHWYDLDLPAVIEIRRQLLPEPDRTTYIAKSLLDPSWCKDIKHTENGVFMIMGGVLFYFEEYQVKQFFSTVADNLPGSEIVFDAIPKLSTLIVNWGLRRTGIPEARVKWAVHDAKEMVQWDNRIKVIDQFPCFKNIPRNPTWGRRTKIWMDFSDKLKMANFFHLRV